MRISSLAILAVCSACAAVPLAVKRQDSSSSSSTTTSIAQGAPATLQTQCFSSGVWAITVDDGPWNYEQQLIKLFNSYNSSSNATVLAQQLNRTNTTSVPLTHYINGLNYGCIYDHAEDIQASFVAGHDFGNHLWQHFHAPSMSSEQFKANVTAVDVAIQRILGVQPALFRFPYGDSSQQNLNDLGALGYKYAINWNVDSGDNNGQSVQYAQQQYDSAISFFPRGVISLNHETNNDSITYRLPYLLSRLANSSFTAVSVADCLGIAPYRNMSLVNRTLAAMPKRTSDWHC